MVSCTQSGDSWPCQLAQCAERASARYIKPEALPNALTSFPSILLHILQTLLQTQKSAESQLQAIHLNISKVRYGSPRLNLKHQLAERQRDEQLCSGHASPTARRHSKSCLALACVKEQVLTNIRRRMANKHSNSANASWQNTRRLCVIIRTSILGEKETWRRVTGPAWDGRC